MKGERKINSMIRYAVSSLAATVLLAGISLANASEPTSTAKTSRLAAGAVAFRQSDP